MHVVPHIRQVWYTDDATAGGSLTALRLSGIFSFFMVPCMGVLLVEPNHC